MLWSIYGEEQILELSVCLKPVQKDEVWTTLRSTVTDDNGKWSLPPVAARKLYYLRFVMKNFNPVELRLKLTKRGKPFVVTLPLST